jgi:hypothetical protein
MVRGDSRWAKFGLKFMVMSLYGIVLVMLGGIIIWAGLSLNLSNSAAIILSVAFFAIEFLLFSYCKPAPGLVVTALLFGPALARIRHEKSSETPEDIRRQIVRDSLLVKYTA